MRIKQKLLSGSIDKTQIKRLGKVASISVLNQVVSSGTNFLLGLYLVRVLTFADFGLYSIGFAISLFYAGIGNALFLTQMVVNVPDKPVAHQSSYVASMGAADAGFCALTFLVVFMALPAGGTLAPWLGQYVEFGIAVAAASGAYHFKDLFTRYSYTARKEVWALKINLVIAVTLMFLLAVQYTSDYPITAVSALWLYAIAQLSGAIAGQVFTKLPFAKVRFGQMWADVKEAWVGARWAVPTNIIYTLRGQAHTIVTAALAGPVGVAFLNATRLLVTPAIFVMPALTQVAVPRLATARSENKERVLQLGIRFTVLVVMISLLYSGILLLFLEPITQLLLGGKYPPSLELALAWCVFVCVHVACINGVMVAQVLKRFQSIFFLNISTVVVMMLAIFVMNKLFDVPGIIYGMAIGDLYLAIIAWRLVAKECKVQPACQ
jgi:O-antigen/teichoic acid export membrane protein